MNKLHILLALSLPFFASTSGCIVVEDDGDDDGAGDTGSADDGAMTDSGTPSDDSGTPPPGDSGTPPDDSGTPPGDSGDPPDDSGGGSDIGQQCTSNDDCNTICLFAGDADYGFCSVPCEDVFDCPDFWECVEVGNATLTYCAPGE